ncbi:hypothetical protein [Terasakiella pusilla]|uniref:hypothetical protein n=1 Tax=Terasakiella pusilla TaxID=64973 RepID=UPI0006912148|nr:hypothetical protein [Terasakiella pusilla]
MKIRIAAVEDTGDEMICDEYIGHDFQSFAEILEQLSTLEKSAPGHIALTSLDDLGQAQYTSIHATLSKDLDDIKGHDLSSLSPESFEDGEHRGYLSNKSEFFIREANFLSKAKETTFEDIFTRHLCITDQEIDALEQVHANPLKYIDSKVLIKVSPVQSSALALVSFPNGYFSCDLNPFENYVLANHLEENYGLRLCGMGASLLGFRHSRKFDVQTALKLGAELAKIYHRENETSVIERFANLVQTHEYFFIKYVEEINL